MIEALHEGATYRLCVAGEPLPPGSVVFAFTVPPTHWDMFTQIMPGKVQREMTGAVLVKWQDGTLNRVRKEFVCVKV